jgi:histidine triad (HIT) family protein
VYLVAEALRREVAAERVYDTFLRSNQVISPVHWHVTPMPSGVPFAEQQLAVFRNGVLQIPGQALVALAQRLRYRLNHSPEKLRQ